MNKKAREIYKSYGIETLGDKLVSPIGLVTPILQEGNSKTGKLVMTFSKLAGTRLWETSYGIVSGTCAFNCKGCYAQTGFFLTPSVKDALAIRTVLMRRYKTWLFYAICAQTEILGEDFELRISASGDLEDEEEAEFWRQIIRRYPKLIATWTYTKRKELEPAFDEFENANIVRSLYKGRFNYGTILYILELYVEMVLDGETPYICRCGIDKKQHCQGCHKCSKNKYVLFIEHSTKYKAEEDPLYDFVTRIINLQETVSHKAIADVIVKHLMEVAA